MSDETTRADALGKNGPADDVCEACGNELKVTGSRVVCEGDDSPDKKTRVFTVLEMECTNPQCSAKGKIKEVFVEQMIGAK